MSKWKSVMDSLPLEEQEVQTVDREGEVSLGYYMDGAWYDKQGDELAPPWYPTHWQHKPKPPPLENAWHWRSYLNRRDEGMRSAVVHAILEELIEYSNVLLEWPDLPGKRQKQLIDRLTTCIKDMI